MKFNFNEMLVKGHEQAEQTLINRTEIQEVFTELRESIIEYGEITVSLYDQVEFEANSNSRPMIGLFEARIPTGYTLLNIGSDKFQKTLFKYKEAPDGYPISIEFLYEKFLCSNQDEFASAISGILSNPQANLIIREVISKLKEANT